MSNEHFFSVGLHELEDGPKELSGPLPNEWLARMLQDTDVQPAGESDGSLDLLLTKNGRDVLVQGHLRTTVSLPCARTLDPAVYEIRPDVFLMLSPAAGTTTENRPRRADRGASKGTKKQKHKGGSGWENDPELSEQDAATDTYSGDKIILDDFLREFVLLELPMVPLRKDLRDKPFEANPPLPGAPQATSLASSQESVDGLPETSTEKPLDPRLSPLAALKAKLENKE